MTDYLDYLNNTADFSLLLIIFTSLFIYIISYATNDRDQFYNEVHETHKITKEILSILKK